MYKFIKKDVIKRKQILVRKTSMYIFPQLTLTNNLLINLHIYLKNLVNLASTKYENKVNIQN